MMKRLIPVLMVAGLIAPALAQSPAADIDARIRQEENAHSQIMRTLHFLADVYGPRLTGTPSLKAAGEWAIKTMESWGFTNGHLEPWDFGHPGWVNERFSAHIISPVKDQLTCEVAGVDAGHQRHRHRGRVPDDSAGAADAAAAHRFLDDAEVARSPARSCSSARPPSCRSTSTRRRSGATTSSCAVSTIRSIPNAGNFGRGGPPRTAAADDRGATEPADRRVPRRERRARCASTTPAREHGQIIEHHNRTYDVTKAVPTVVMRNEDYGRIARILADGTPVELEFNIVNTWYPEGKTAYNTIAEIPGSDKKDEIVMLGGHLDSWNVGDRRHRQRDRLRDDDGGRADSEGDRRQAAPDDPRRAVERRRGRPARIARLRRAALRIRRASEAGVREAGCLPEHRFRARAARAARAFSDRRRRRRSCAQALAPFRDLGVVGAVATKSRNVAGTDSTSFNNAGLPGIGFSQDPIEYNTHTHHTNLDNYERIIEDDVKASAISIAATLYELAMRDDMVPRFSAAEMPPPVPARTGSH